MKVRLKSAGLKVTDFDAMVRFYRDDLGLPVSSLKDGTADRKSCVFDLEGVSFYLRWDSESASVSARASTARLDFVVDDVDAVYARLTGRGVTCKGPPHRTGSGVKGFSVRDPEGNVLHILAG